MHNLNIKHQKCHFFKEEEEFWGKLVRGSGTSIAPNKLQAVKEWPVPQNSKELMSFLGFMNYHHHHMPGFAKVSADLYTLAHASDFFWTWQHQPCVEKLKAIAISAPCLPICNLMDYLFSLAMHLVLRMVPSFPKFKMVLLSPFAMPAMS